MCVCVCVIYIILYYNLYAYIEALTFLRLKLNYQNFLHDLKMSQISGSKHVLLQSEIRNKESC